MLKDSITSMDGLNLPYCFKNTHKNEEIASDRRLAYDENRCIVQYGQNLHVHNIAQRF
jgi:hypothetical protein